MTNNAPNSCDLLIHNGIVLTVDEQNTVVDDGAVAIRDGRICAVGPTQDIQARFTATETFDAHACVVHPGFIDAHIHISQYTSRSVLPRMSGTAITMGDWKAALSPADEHASASLAAVDYLRRGYTGFVDPGTIFEPDAVAPVAQEAGIRIWLTDPYVADQVEVLARDEPDLVSPGFMRRWPANTDEALKRLGSQLFRNREQGSLVRGFVGLYGAGTATRVLHETARNIARENGVQFQEHRGYNPRAYLDEESRNGCSTIARLADEGVLGPGTTFTHMNVVHPGDISILAEFGTRIIWCPFAQLRALGAGPAEPRMLELHEKGVSVALATDIPRTQNFDALGSVAVAGLAATGRPARGTEILRMRTIDAARSIGADEEVGSLEVGKFADIVVRSPIAGEMLGVDPVWETAVLGLTEPPRLVLTNGVPQFRDGATVRLDMEKTQQDARGSARRMMNRVGL
ncbi:amidohydrolase family protein [Sinorhizobium meliloti]|nr:amidohydrolase family protein [Sinorhizobium meliloti]